MIGTKPVAYGLLLAACALPHALAGTSVEGDPSRLISEIRASVTDPTAAVAVNRLDLEMGPGLLTLESGVLIPAATPGGRVFELVFVGTGRFRVEPPDTIEAGQLELFTGSGSLDVAVEEAVLVLANRQAIDGLLQRAAVVGLTDEIAARARTLHAQWHEATESRNGGVDASIFRSLVGDAAFENFFTLWCSSSDVGEFVFQFDPEDVEQITLASFDRMDLSAWERAKMRRHIRIQQRKGRWLGLRLEDLGAWDIWLSMPWTPTDGVVFDGSTGFESRHYELDVTIQRRFKRLVGRARLQIETMNPGSRVVRLQMLPDLTADEVLDAAGKPLFAFRSGIDLLVLLPEAPAPGQMLSLEVRYSGRALNWVGGKAFDLEDTSAWYPHCGTIDRATYDVRLNWPGNYTVAASGKRVESGRHGRYRWERRTIDIPSMAFSFVMGDFLIEHRRIGNIDLELALHRDPKVKLTPTIRKQMFDTVSDAMAYFEAKFGDYPLDYLTVVTIPRKFSQSYLGFVALADSILEHHDPTTGSTNWVRDTTIAHELAHQWWGNLVGWYSYRDQWLSEGMANYSALLFDGHKEGGDSNLLAVMSSGWRDSLSESTIEGRSIESLGPIVLGNRLNSSRARNAYRSIIYRKGAVVLAMLARAVGEQRFLEMLRSFSEAASSHVMTTENFLLALERMSGLELDGFARQFIYGTGIPQVYYDYELKSNDAGHWSVEGEAHLITAPHFRYEIRLAPTGRWDVIREPGFVVADDSTTLMVPYRVLVSEGGTHKALEGRLFLEGRTDEFSVETALPPLELKLDPRGEVLAWFYSVARYPKRVLRYQANDLAFEGRFGEAEQRYRQALTQRGSKLTDRDPLRPGDEIAIDGDAEDLRIRLDLVRLYLLQDRDSEAARMLDAIDAALEVDSILMLMEREALRARIDVRSAAYDAAYRRLKKVLRTAVPRRKRSGWREQILQRQLTHDRLAVTEAFTLFAIASLETGHRADLGWAMGQARVRGADVSALGVGDDSALPSWVAP